jgi:hypothetical protein
MDGKILGRGERWMEMTNSRAGGKLNSYHYTWGTSNVQKMHNNGY